MVSLTNFSNCFKLQTDYYEKRMKALYNFQYIKIKFSPICVQVLLSGKDIYQQATTERNDAKYQLHFFNVRNKNELYGQKLNTLFNFRNVYFWKDVQTLTQKTK